MCALEALPEKPAIWSSARLKMAITSASGDSEQVVALDRPFAVVSYGPDGDVHFSSRPGRQRVLYLHGTPQGVYAVTLVASRSGRPGPRGNWLCETDQLTIGHARLRVWMEGSGVLTAFDNDVPNLLTPSTETNDVPRLEIVFPADAAPRIERRLRRPLTIVGRGPQALIRVEEPSVSLVHCAIYRQDGRAWVVDLSSETGTRLNGKVVDVAELTPGDLLELGATRVRCLAAEHNEFGRAVAADASGNHVPAKNGNPQPEGYERTRIRDAGGYLRDVASQASRQNEVPAALHAQVAEVRARLEALSRERIEWRRQLEGFREAISAEKQSRDRLLESVEQNDVRWATRFKALQERSEAIDAAGEAALGNLRDEWTAEKERRHKLEEAVASMQTATRPTADSEAGAAHQLEAVKAGLAEMAHEISQLKEMMERISRTQGSTEQNRRQDDLEANQRAHEARLEEVRRRTGELTNAMGDSRAASEAEQRRTGDAVASLRAAVNTVNEQLAALAQEAEEHARRLDDLRSQQNEAAEEVRLLRQEILARPAAVELTSRESLAEVTSDGDVDGVHDSAEISDQRAEPCAAANSAPALSLVSRQPAVELLKDEAPTDRLLQRQLDLESGLGGRGRLRWSLTLALVALGTAAALWHFGLLN
jgi:hypothetical protein